mmetsp:Transcript_24300/g.76163  ORF Transcript_24300/g.76163 Transcript_24300/m.76163 type:complete len:268 (+) Transcript_24300:267-1070(+)
MRPSAKRGSAWSSGLSASLPPPSSMQATISCMSSSFAVLLSVMSTISCMCSRRMRRSSARRMSEASSSAGVKLRSASAVLGSSSFASSGRRKSAPASIAARKAESCALLRRSTDASSILGANSSATARCLGASDPPSCAKRIITSSGVRPMASGAPASAPLSSSSATMSGYAPTAAQWSGVPPRTWIAQTSSPDSTSFLLMPSAFSAADAAPVRLPSSPSSSSNNSSVPPIWRSSSKTSTPKPQYELAMSAPLPTPSAAARCSSGRL